MLDYLNIGAVPNEEDCAQIGSPDYNERALKECAAYKHQLKRMYPEVTFRIKSFSHDFGRYYEVVAVWEDGDEDAMENAFDAEMGADRWDDIAREELGLD